MNEESQLNADRVEELRQALYACRMMNARDGNLLTWNEVSERLRLSQVFDVEGAAGGKSQIGSESLRRFATGAFIPNSDRLVLLRKFLVESGCLIEGDSA